MTAVPDAWKEFCRITLMNNTRGAQGTGEIAFEGFTEDITAMDFGEKDIEGVPLLSGGRITRNVPMTDESITLKVYPVSVDIANNEGVAQFFHRQDTPDTSQPILVSNTKERIPYRAVFLWSTKLPASASARTIDGEPAIRMTMVNVYVTRYVPSNDGKILSAEMTLKWTPFDENGVENKREESTDGTVYMSTATASSTAFTFVNNGD